MNIHKIWALLIVLCVLLSACHIGGADSTVEQTAGPSETEEVKTTDPPLDQQEIMYNTAPDAYYPFQFDGNSPSTNKYIDTSVCQIGMLYVFDETKNKVYPISEGQLPDGFGSHFSTKDHVYYRLSDEPNKIFRSDYTGQNKTVVFESEYGSVNFASYFGTDANGKLVVVEANKRVILYDIPTRTYEVLMEQYYIESAHYTADSKSYTSEDKGPTLRWYGKLNESDVYGCYIYHIETKENWKATWN